MGVPRQYRVAVFVEESPRGHSMLAYVREYNPEWEGCNIVSVHAASGEEAKKTAKARIKRMLKETPQYVQVIKRRKRHEQPVRKPTDGWSYL